MNSQSIMWLAALSLMVPSLVSGQVPVPVLDVARLVLDSDVIVVGTVQSRSEQGSKVIDIQGQRASVRWIIAEMLVDRTLKGTIEGPVLHVPFAEPVSQVGYRGLRAGTYRLLFLKRLGGAYEFVSPYYPSLGAVPIPPVEGAEPADRVAAAIAAVVESPSSDRNLKVNALFQLSTLRSAVSITALRRALDEVDENVRLSAATALLELNDVTGLPMAERALLGGEHAMSDVVAHNLRQALSRLAAEEAIPGLSRLLKSSDVSTRRAAAAGLRRVRSRPAMPALFSALDDSDWEVRYYAVIGLAEITGESAWRSDMDTFRTSEDTYLTSGRSGRGARSRLRKLWRPSCCVIVLPPSARRPACTLRTTAAATRTASTPLCS